MGFIVSEISVHMQVTPLFWAQGNEQGKDVSERSCSLLGSMKTEGRGEAATGKTHHLGHPQPVTHLLKTHTSCLELPPSLSKVKCTDSTLAFII